MGGVGCLWKAVFEVGPQSLGYRRSGELVVLSLALSCLQSWREEMAICGGRRGRRVEVGIRLQLWEAEVVCYSAQLVHWVYR